jgi:hypothetical protein
MLGNWVDAIHTYDPDEEGRCKSGWYNESGKWIPCRSTQRSSVLHDDPESEFRQMHDHGGGDCMCFEDENGPSFYEAMAQFVKERAR